MATPRSAAASPSRCDGGVGAGHDDVVALPSHDGPTVRQQLGVRLVPKAAELLHLEHARRQLSARRPAHLLAGSSRDAQHPGIACVRCGDGGQADVVVGRRAQAEGAVPKVPQAADVRSSLEASVLSTDDTSGRDPRAGREGPPFRDAARTVLGGSHGLRAVRAAGPAVGAVTPGPGVAAVACAMVNDGDRVGCVVGPPQDATMPAQPRMLNQLPGCRSLERGGPRPSAVAGRGSS